MSVRPWRQHWQDHITDVTAVPGVYKIFISRIAQTPLVIYHNPVTVVRMWTCDRSWLNHLVKHTPCNHTLAFLGILPFACPQSPRPLSPNSHPLGGLRRYSLGRTTMVPGTLELAESPAVPWLSKKVSVWFVLHFFARFCHDILHLSYLLVGTTWFLCLNF